MDHRELVARNEGSTKADNVETSARAIARRKNEHLDIVLGQDVGPSDGARPFDAFAFEHVAMPALALADIDIATTFLGQALDAPLLISSMTGGPARAEAINMALGEAASETRIALAVGSQRIAIEAAGDAGLGKRIRQAASNVPLLANVGAAQVAAWPDPSTALRAVDMIEADALIVHFNPLQEAVQSGGDTDWREIRDRLGRLVAASPVPVIAKEVGCGISGATARELADLGISIIDVAGQGGTSWAAVEARRADDPDQARIAEAFRDWGIPTPRAILDVKAQCPGTTVIASGGVHDGLDVAKAIRLGADLVGQAAGLLAAAVAGTEAVVRQIEVTKAQISVACFCTNSRNLGELRKARLMLS